MSVGIALTELGIENYRLTGEPTSQEEFESSFIKYTGKDENDVAIESNYPADFGVTWSDIQTKIVELETELPLRELRNERTKLLIETDWMALSDSSIPLSDEWKDYRQALRDIPSNYTSLDNVVWPTKPT